MSKLAYHLFSGRRAAAQPARVRLVLFGFAGGSITSLLSLVKRLPSWIEVWGAEYPGRGLRWNVDPLHTLPSLLDDLTPGLRGLCDQPVALLGYSMGANVAYRLALSLGEQILGVVAASAAPPSRQETASRIHASADAVLLEHLKGLGGIPPEILANQIIMNSFLPVVRADLACCADMSRLIAPSLACPVLAMHGDDDRVVSSTDGAQWLRVAGGAPRHSLHKVYRGGHFFHHGVEDGVAGDIAGWIAQLIGPAYLESRQALPFREAQLSANNV